MAFANVKVISREIQSAGRGAKVEKEKKEQGVAHQVAAHQMLIVHPPILSVQSLDSANVQHTSLVILSAGVHQQKQQQEKEEDALQMPIAQLQTRFALNLVSASVSATSLEMQSAGAKEIRFAAVRPEEEEMEWTQAANRMLIVLSLTPL